VIHAPGALNRAPRRFEAAAAEPYLPPLLALLPRLAVVVPAGRFAQAAAAPLSTLRPDLPVVPIPHPSPTYVCTSPSVRERILAGLIQAKSLLGRRP
jgi:uracil-DNA glycosylase